MYFISKSLLVYAFKLQTRCYVGFMNIFETNTQKYMNKVEK